MTPQPDSLLANYRVLRTHDANQFHAYITSMEGGHERHITSSGPIELELRHVALGRVDVGLSHFNVPVTVRQRRQSSDCYLVQFPLTGGIDLELDDQNFQVAPGEGAVISPSQRVCRTGKPGWMLGFRIAGELVRSRFAERGGCQGGGLLVFHPLIRSASRETRGYGLLIVEAIDRGLAEPGAVVTEVLERSFVDLLLDLQPHNKGATLADSHESVRAGRIRAVATYVTEHVRDRYSAKSLAEAAGCSVRSLQSTFVGLCGMSPMEFVLRQRLSYARKLLEKGTHDSRVSEIASEAGFTQLSRFAAEYKARYGELPSETLRRSTSSVAGRNR